PGSASSPSRVFGVFGEFILVGTDYQLAIVNKSDLSVRVLLNARNYDIRACGTDVVALLPRTYVNGSYTNTDRICIFNQQTFVNMLQNNVFDESAGQVTAMESGDASIGSKIIPADYANGYEVETIGSIFGNTSIRGLKKNEADEWGI